MRISLTSLVALLSLTRLLAAVSLVSRPGSPIRMRSKGYGGSDSCGGHDGHDGHDDYDDYDGYDGYDGNDSNDDSNDSDCPVLEGSNAELEIVNKVIAPDGFSRTATLANGVFPGPVIKAQKGQDFSINVINKLDDPTLDLTTTIHWHGIFQNRSNWADGVSFVTQCPIRPGENFRYQFNAEDQTGTYWYHSHHELQYCDGLRGAMVIYDPHDPLSHLYDVDNEYTIMTLSDWWHAHARDVPTPFTPNTTLINGKGRYSEGPKTPLAVINVEQGKRYRFRIIGLSCDAYYNFTIDGHRMTIIETDGVEVVPTEVDGIQILAGQRYSVVVDADQPIDNYWIRALPNHGNQTFIGGQNSAILRYAGAPTEDPTTKQGPVVAPFDENQLHPLDQTPPPGIAELGKADVVLHLVPGYDNVSFYLNGASFHPPPTPVLLQILSGARHPTELLPSGSVYELPRNKVIEISMPANEFTPGGAKGNPHGIHLHGHNFHVVRTSTSNETNFLNPVRRDVVSMGSQGLGSNITFRFVTDNPGPWILHCHIDFHVFNGFAVVLAEAPDGAAVQQNSALSNAWDDLCPALDVAPGVRSTMRPTTKTKTVGASASACVVGAGVVDVQTVVSTPTGVIVGANVSTGIVASGVTSPTGTVAGLTLPTPVVSGTSVPTGAVEVTLPTPVASRASLTTGVVAGLTLLTPVVAGANNPTVPGASFPTPVNAGASSSTVVTGPSEPIVIVGASGPTIIARPNVPIVVAVASEPTIIARASRRWGHSNGHGLAFSNGFPDGHRGDS